MHYKSNKFRIPGLEKDEKEGEVYNPLVGWEWKMKRKSSSPLSLSVDPMKDLASLSHCKVRVHFIKG